MRPAKIVSCAFFLMAMSCGGLLSQEIGDVDERLYASRNYRSYLVPGMHVFEGRRISAPLSSYRDYFNDNIAHIKSISDRNVIWAGNRFLRSVSEKRIPEFDGIARAYGPAPDWNPKKNGGSLGEIVGNMNYAAVGRNFLTRELSAIGVPADYSERLGRAALRLGGGGYQIFSDAKLVWDDKASLSDVWSKRRTFYGESVDDVESIEAGFAVGRYLELESLARQAGVDLNPADFGIDPVVARRDDMAERRSFLWERHLEDELRRDAERRDLLRLRSP